MFNFRKNEYNRLVKFAYKQVGVLQGYYDEGSVVAYTWILLGSRYYNISVDGKEHNYKAVVDAIHLYQKNNPDKPVMEAFYKGLCLIAEGAGSYEAVQRVLNYLNYELEVEKTNEKAFELDVTGVLVVLRENIKNYKGTFREKNQNTDDMYYQQCDDVEQRSKKGR